MHVHAAKELRFFLQKASESGGLLQQKFCMLWTGNYNSRQKSLEYTIVDIGVLEGVLNEACVCKVCKSGALSSMKQSHIGVVDKLKIMCNNIGCQTRTTFFTSKSSNFERKENSKGPTPFALNIRFALGMQCIGKGNRAL